MYCSVVLWIYGATSFFIVYSGVPKFMLRYLGCDTWLRYLVAILQTDVSSPQELVLLCVILHWGCMMVSDGGLSGTHSNYVMLMSSGVYAGIING